MSRIIKASFVTQSEDPKLIKYSLPYAEEESTEEDIAEDLEESAEEVSEDEGQTLQEEKMFDDLVNLEKMKKETLIWKESIIQETNAELEAKKKSIDEYVARKSAEVEEESARILAEAQSKAEKMREEAREAGLSAGKKEGVEMVEKECASYLSEAKESLVRALEEKNRIINDSEPEIIHLALEIAKKVIKKTVELDAEIVNSITDEAIKRATHRERIVIRVNINDLPSLEKERSLLREKSSCKDLIILADPTVLAGGCVLETDLGTVDARIETQIEQIEEQLVKLAEANKEVKV